MNKRALYDKRDLGNVFGLAVAVMLVGQVVLALLFLPFATDGSLPDWAFWLMQALYTLAIGGTAFLYAAITNTNVWQATAMNRPPQLKHVGWGCLATTFLIALMLPLNELLMKLIESVGLPLPSVDLPMQVAPLILVSCVLAAATEEILFRGTVARSLQGQGNRLQVLAISGTLFAIFHLNPAQTLHQFVLGAFLTLLVFRSGSVWTTVLVHFFNNLVAVILTFTIADEAIFVDYWFVFVPIGLVGFAACLFGYLKTTGDNWTRREVVSSEENTDNATETRFARSNLFLAIGVAVCVVLWIASLLGWL